MTALLGWVRPLLAAAVLLGTVEALIPEGPVRLTGSFAVGLALFCVIAEPLTQVLPLASYDAWSEETIAASAVVTETERDQKSYLSQVMSEGCAEYIEAKAGQLGMSIQAEVQCEERNELPVPVSVVISGASGDDRRNQLIEQISEGLQIPAEGICFEEVNP